MNSDKIKRELGWVPKRTVEDAVRDFITAFQAGKVPNALTDPRYYNIKTAQAMYVDAAAGGVIRYRIRCSGIRRIPARTTGILANSATR